MTPYVMLKRSTYTRVYLMVYHLSTVILTIDFHLFISVLSSTLLIHTTVPMVRAGAGSDRPSDDTGGTTDISVETYKQVGVIYRFDNIINILFQILRQKQAEINQLTVQLTNKDKEIATVANCQLMAHPNQQPPTAESEDNGQTKKPKNIYISNTVTRNKVKHLARKFTYMSSFWVRPTDVQFFELERDPLYEPRNRYRSEDMQQQGLLSDLLASTPEILYSDMGSEAFSKQVS